MLIEIPWSAECGWRKSCFWSLWDASEEEMTFFDCSSNLCQQENRSYEQQVIVSEGLVNLTVFCDSNIFMKLQRFVILKFCFYNFNKSQRKKM